MPTPLSPTSRRLPHPTRNLPPPFARLGVLRHLERVFIPSPRTCEGRKALTSSKCFIDGASVVARNEEGRILSRAEVRWTMALAGKLCSSSRRACGFYEPPDSLRSI
jgi:hypothetical protein